LLPAAYGGILARMRMGPSHSKSGISDSVRQAVAVSEELKRSALLQSFALPHMRAYAEDTGRMGELPVSLCFYNCVIVIALQQLLGFACICPEHNWTKAVRCRLLQMGSLPKVVAACISLFACCCYTCTVAGGRCVNVNSESTLILAWCCSPTQRSQ